MPCAHGLCSRSVAAEELEHRGEPCQILQVKFWHNIAKYRSICWTSYELVFGTAAVVTAVRYSEQTFCFYRYCVRMSSKIAELATITQMEILPIALEMLFDSAMESVAGCLVGLITDILTRYV